MIVQMFFTTIFGLGVLTLATIALLNTVGHRIYELQRTNHTVKPRDPLFFEYTYVSDRAQSLRVKFANLPRLLAIKVALGIGFVSVSTPWIVAEQSHLPNEEEVASWLLLIVSLYIIFLVAYAGSLVWDLFKVMQEFDRYP